MKQKYKELLLKDLCARLPYGVKFGCDVKGVWTLKGIIHNSANYICWPNAVALEVVKPYLRPMSSMTEEECKTLGNIPATLENNLIEILPNIPYYIEVAVPEQIDWLNAHHFDYRGLLERGLALEAPADMYNIKEK